MNRGEEIDHEGNDCVSRKSNAEVKGSDVSKIERNL